MKKESLWRVVAERMGEKEWNLDDALSTDMEVGM
jgi:hypothetical protein